MLKNLSSQERINPVTGRNTTIGDSDGQGKRKYSEKRVKA